MTRVQNTTEFAPLTHWETPDGGEPLPRTGGDDDGSRLVLPPASSSGQHLGPILLAKASDQTDRGCDQPHLPASDDYWRNLALGLEREDTRRSWAYLLQRADTTLASGPVPEDTTPCTDANSGGSAEAAHTSGTTECGGSEQGISDSMCTALELLRRTACERVAAHGRFVEMKDTVLSTALGYVDAALASTVGPVLPANAPLSAHFAAFCIYR